MKKGVDKLLTIVYNRDTNEGKEVIQSMAEKVWTEKEVVDLAFEKFNGNREKAELWIIDHDGWLPDENKEEIKASIKEATKGAKSSEKSKREYKPREKDAEKVEIIKNLDSFLEKCYNNVVVTNEQKEIAFTIGDNEYSISLIKHRKPKKS